MGDSIKHSSMPATDPERFEAFSVPATLPAPACRWAGSKARSRLCLFSSAVVILRGGAGGTHGEPVARLPVDAAVATDRIADSVSQASQRFAIPSAWIWAVMRAESLGDADALSPEGAMGLMQIMPGTWSELRSRYGLGADPYDPHDNIMAGAAYMRELHDRFGKPGSLRHTMRALVATKSTLRLGDRFPQRRCHTWPLSRRCWARLLTTESLRQRLRVPHGSPPRSSYRVRQSALCALNR